jgi:biotin carboxyl carrier protein
MAEFNENTEERLRAEIEELKRRLQDHHPAGSSRHHRRPSGTTLWVLGVLAVMAIAGGFVVGYLPSSIRQTALAKEAQENTVADTLVNVALVTRSPEKSELILPGSIQAVTEAPILARASGYISKRYADIGDRVKEGDLLAEIDAPELGQQVRQAKPVWIRHLRLSSRPMPIWSRARPTPRWPALRPSAGAVS